MRCNLKWLTLSMYIATTCYSVDYYKILIYTTRKWNTDFLALTILFLIAVPCRINYSKTNWDLILKTLADETQFQVIEVRNRMQIVDDLFAFAAADILDYEFVLSAIMYLQYEKDYLPWGVALSSLRDIRSFFMRTELYEAFQVRYNLPILLNYFLTKLPT